MGGEYHRYYKHNKFRQNPRGDPKFLVDLTRNDPYQKLHDALFRYVHIPVCAIPLVFTMYDQLIRIYVVVAPIHVQYSSTCTINPWLSKP